MRKCELVYTSLGLRIRMLRDMCGLTQKQLGAKIGTGHTRASIANIEAGKQRIHIHDIPDLANALDTSPEALLRGIWSFPNKPRCTCYDARINQRKYCQIHTTESKDQTHE